MRSVNMHQAKTHLSRLVEEASAGKEVVIAKAGKPIARLVPAKGVQRRRNLSVLAGKFTVPPTSTLRCRMRWWHSSKDRVVRLLVDTRILLWAAMDPERLPASFREYIDELPVTAAHVARVSRLPLHHRDPTDRPLIAQALHEPMCFLTLDRTLTCYSDLVEVGT